MNPTQQLYEDTLKDVKRLIRQTHEINTVARRDWILEVQHILNKELDDLQSIQGYDPDVF